MTAALAACKADPSSTDRPARIVEPTRESRAELARVVAGALNRADVTLADDALTHSSVLIVEPIVLRDAQNNRVMGRDYGTPIQFQLMMRGRQCVLERRGSEERWPLYDTKCAGE